MPLPPDLLIALIGFAFVSSITPGPNNMMLLASGVNYGFRRTLPHMLGVSLGHSLMVVLVGLGLAGLFLAYPLARTALTVVSVVYLCWLAWKIAHAAPPDPAAPKGRPMTFIQAALFQWVNPKAWSMALTAVSLYTPDTSLASIVTVALVFCATNLPSVSAWAALGTALRGWLRDPARLRAFNWTMAALLVLSLYPVLLP